MAGTWDAMLRGASGVRLLDDPAMKAVPIPVGAPLLVEPGAALRPLQRRRLSRRARMAVTVAMEARTDAGLAGIGISSDCYHMVLPEPDGLGDAMAIRAPLDDAGVTAADVVHVNANGTSTVPGDAAEARALQSIFGDATGGPAVSANKSMIGHTLGAAGAIESVATVLSIYHGVVPATVNYEQPDEDVSIDVVRDAPRKLAGQEIVAVKNSSGFGGHNVALTFRGVPVQNPYGG